MDSDRSRKTPDSGILTLRDNLLLPGVSASLVAQSIKNPPATQETWVQSLGWEDPLENGKVTHSSILDWRISWTCTGSVVLAHGLRIPMACRIFPEQG